VLTIFICVVFFHLSRAAKNLHKISEALRDNFKDSEDFVVELKERLENNLVFRMFFPPVVTKQQTKTKSSKIKKNEKQNNK
jgi:hypothetical protein